MRAIAVSFMGWVWARGGSPAGRGEGERRCGGGRNTVHGLRSFLSVGRRNKNVRHRTRRRVVCGDNVEAVLELRLGAFAGVDALLAFDHTALKIGVRSGRRAVRMAVFAVLSRHFLSGDAPAQASAAHAASKILVMVSVPFLSELLTTHRQQPVSPCRRGRGGMDCPTM